MPVPDPKGYAFNFYPDKPITREEAAQTIVRALKLNKAQQPADNYLASKFKDYQNISPEYKEYVAVASYYGILSGNSIGNISPKSQVSRGELCVIMNTLLQKGAIINEGFKPAHQPWTIEFVNFDRPDYNMVHDFPDYNKTQAFYGKVTESVLGFNNSHLVLIYTESDANDRDFEKTVHVYLTDKDLDLFSKRDWVTFYYDRNNNILSYSLNGKIFNISKVK